MSEIIKSHFSDEHCEKCKSPLNTDGTCTATNDVNCKNETIEIVIEE